MGACSIVSNLGAGLYEVNIIYDLQNLDPSISTISNQLAVSNDRVSVLQGLSASNLNIINTALTDIDVAISNADTVLAKALTQKINTHKLLGHEIDLDLQRQRLLSFSFEKNLTTLNNTKSDYETNRPVLQAWCADLSENLSGDVDTIELYREFGSDFTLIAPGGVDPNNNLTKQPLEISASANIVYNLISLPAFQKYKPTFVIAVVLAVDAVNAVISASLFFYDSSVVNYDGSNNNIVSQEAVAVSSTDYMQLSSFPFLVNDLVILSVERVLDVNAYTCVGYLTNPQGAVLSGGYDMEWYHDPLSHESTETRVRVYDDFFGESYYEYKVCFLVDDNSAIATRPSDIEFTIDSFIATTGNNLFSLFWSSNAVDATIVLKLNQTAIAVPGKKILELFVRVDVPIGSVQQGVAEFQASISLKDKSDNQTKGSCTFDFLNHAVNSPNFEAGVVNVLTSTDSIFSSTNSPGVYNITTF